MSAPTPEGIIIDVTRFNDRTNYRIRPKAKSKMTQHELTFMLGALYRTELSRIEPDKRQILMDALFPQKESIREDVSINEMRSGYLRVEEIPVVEEKEVEQTKEVINAAL